MREELEQALYAAAPRLYGCAATQAPDTFQGFECGDGWFDLLLEASKKLEALIDRYPEMQATQVKEKYGSLRLYLSEEPDQATPIVTQAAVRSVVTCESCGEPGQFHYIRGWCRTNCDACHTRVIEGADPKT